MIGARFAASLIAGTLALSLGLMGCGSKSVDTNAGSVEEPASNSADAPSNSSSSSGSPASNIDALYAGTLYWEGALDSGATFFWMNDSAAQNAQIIVFHGQDGEIPSLSFSGPVSTSTDKTEVTVTDGETAQRFSFKITDIANADSISIDAGEHGTGALAAITPEQFQSDTEPILAEIGTNSEEQAKDEEAPEEAREGEPNEEEYVEVEAEEAV